MMCLGVPEPGDSGGCLPQPGERHCPLLHSLLVLSEGLAQRGWGPREEEWPPDHSGVATWPPSGHRASRKLWTQGFPVMGL